MLVPGVSGGSMAILLNIYDDLIWAVGSFFRHKRESLWILGLFSLGGFAGMFLLAAPLLHLIERYPGPMLFFFAGAVAGSVPMMMRKAQVRRITWRVAVYPAAGLLSVLLMAAIPAEGLPLDGAGQIPVLAAVGMVAAVALVLPGISVSYLLLVMGLYDKIIGAVAALDLTVLLPVGAGLLLGIFLTTRLLERAMAQYPQPTYLVILGFMAGSMLEVVPTGLYGLELLLSVGSAVVGFGVVSLVSGRVAEGQKDSLGD